MKHPSALLFFLATAPSITPAQSESASAILARYESYRPTVQQLAMYQLDWAPSLDAARTRAKKEQRPILLVVIHAQYGDIHSGHC